MARNTKTTYKSMQTKRAEFEAFVVSEGAAMLTQEVMNDFSDALNSYDKPEMWALWNSLSQRGQHRLVWVANRITSDESFADFMNQTYARSVRIQAQNKAEEYITEQLESLVARENAAAGIERVSVAVCKTNDELKVALATALARAERAEGQAQYWQGYGEQSVICHNETKAELTAINDALALLGRKMAAQ